VLERKDHGPVHSVKKEVEYGQKQKSEEKWRERQHLYSM
jgi:hypothetical protein